MYREKNLKKYSLDRPGRITKKKKTCQLTTGVKTINNENLVLLNSKLSEKKERCIDDKIVANLTNSVISESSEILTNLNPFHSDEKSSTDIPTLSTKQGHSSQFQQNLSSWAIENNVSLKGVSELLKILNEDGKYKNLPKDARTLLNTPRNIPIRNMDNGQYIYLGIKTFFRQFLNWDIINDDTVYISINVDGIQTTLATRTYCF